MLYYIVERLIYPNINYNQYHSIYCHHNIDNVQGRRISKERRRPASLMNVLSNEEIMRAAANNKNEGNFARPISKLPLFSHTASQPDYLDFFRGRLGRTRSSSCVRLGKQACGKTPQHHHRVYSEQLVLD